MRILLPVLLLVASITFADDTKKPEAPPPPIVVSGEPAKIAEIDPKTLKVTYSKGADVKAFAEQMVKAWASATAQLQQCGQQLEAARAKEKK